MEPTIQGTEFGSITVAGEVYDHDIVIRLGGEVKRRKKQLSKEQSGTFRVVSLDEAKHILDEGAERLIVGTGQYGALNLSEKAERYFKDNGCSIELHPTFQAVQAWNEAEGKTVGMFHVTC